MIETVIIWNQIFISGINLPASTKIKTQLFADDQVTIDDSEDNLQRGVFTLRNTAKSLECKCEQKNLRRWPF
jgi:hypothetical protein